MCSVRTGPSPWQISLTQPGERAFLDEKAVTGSPEELARHIQTFADAGVDQLLVMLDPVGPAGVERFVHVVELLS